MVALVRRLGLVGQVKVFELALVDAGFDLALQLVGQLALLCDGGEDGLAARDQVAEIAEFVFSIADLDFVERARRLLAVAGYERDSAAFIEQRDGRDERVKRHIQGSGDVKQEFWR